MAVLAGRFINVQFNNLENMFRSLLLSLLLFPMVCLAQDDASQKIITKFSNYSASHPGEKVYLQFDRPYYAAGDTLYYKAYLTLAGSHQLSALSGVLHVELIDNLQGKTLLSEKLQVINGAAWGDFALPDTLANGSYKIRAYTNLMRNDGESAFFTKDIAVVPVKVKSPLISKASSAAAPVVITQPAGLDLQFFPEGGTLVDGVPAKIAFKAIGRNGMGTNIEGEVMDNNQKVVCKFASSHLGMGAFQFTPQKGKTYKATINYAGGMHSETDLPAATDEGVTLSAVNDSMLVIPVTVHASPGYFQANKGKVFILAIFSGGQLTNIPYPLDSVTVQSYLYKKKLHTGITRLTLFSPTGEPLCERLVFINNNDQLKLTANSEQPVYGKRQKVVVHVNAKDIKGIASAGDFSVSVTDEGKAPVDTNAEGTIANYLLLSSELKGNIEQPNYYFNDSGYKAQSDLDNLMLTQGYRRFEWKAVMSNTDTVPRYQPEKLLSISGVVKTLKGNPVPNAEVALGAIKQRLALDTIANGDGEFAFNNLDITDTAKLLIRAGKGNRSWKTEITSENMPVIEKVLANDTAGIKAETAVKPEIAVAMQKEYRQYGSMKNGITLKQVNIHEDKNPEHLVPLIHSDNLNGAGRADQVIMGDQLIGCGGGLAECLASLLHGVRLVYPGPIIYSIRTPIALSGSTRPMAVMLNGVITDQSALNEVSAQDVYSIEVLESPGYLSIYGPQASGGLLVITTRNGSERGFVNTQPGLTTYLFHGFYKARQFYAPTYEVNTPTKNSLDVRTTIAWKPVLLTDKDGNASFDFYTADNPGNYRIVIEGIDAAGNIGRVVSECKVQ
jgi:hypothetical protein